MPISNIFSSQIPLMVVDLNENRILKSKNLPVYKRVKIVDMQEQIVNISSTKIISTQEFEVIFKDNYDGLFRYAYTIVKDEYISEDIVQGVFMAFWHDRAKTIIHTSVKAFLYKSVYFQCMNKIKHEKVVQKYTNASTTSEPSTDDDTLVYKEISEAVSLAIQNLPDQCRKIFKMSRFEGLKYHEIADHLQLSPKTVENQMGKALKTMRVALSEYMQIIVLIILSHLS